MFLWLLRSISVEGVLNPVHLDSISAGFIDGHHVEAQRPAAIARILLEKMLCGAQQFFRLRVSTESAALPKPRLRR